MVTWKEQNYPNPLECIISKDIAFLFITDNEKYPYLYIEIFLFSSGTEIHVFFEDENMIKTDNWFHKIRNKFRDKL
jgi:hypothetical protein